MYCWAAMPRSWVSNQCPASSRSYTMVVRTRMSVEGSSAPSELLSVVVATHCCKSHACHMLSVHKGDLLHMAVHIAYNAVSNQTV